MTDQPTPRPYILIAEDEAAQAEILEYNLRHEGYEVARAKDGQEALRAVQERAPDLVVLDWMLPEVSGLEVCRRLRNAEATRHVPILMLTARGEEDDRVRGFEVGADDYVVKPYSPRELVARIKSVLRRTHPAVGAEQLVYKNIVMDLATHKVTRDGTTLKLGPTEFRLLKTFLERPTRVLSRDRLMDLAWGSNIFIDGRTVDVHIRRLREALNVGRKPDPIRTVRGTGYALDLDEA